MKRSVFTVLLLICSLFSLASSHPDSVISHNEGPIEATPTFSNSAKYGKTATKCRSCASIAGRGEGGVIFYRDPYEDNVIFFHLDSASRFPEKFSYFLFNENSLEGFQTYLLGSSELASYFGVGIYLIQGQKGTYKLIAVDGLTGQVISHRNLPKRAQLKAGWNEMVIDRAASGEFSVLINGCICLSSSAEGLKLISENNSIITAVRASAKDAPILVCSKLPLRTDKATWEVIDVDMERLGDSVTISFSTKGLFKIGRIVIQSNTGADFGWETISTFQTPPFRQGVVEYTHKVKFKNSALRLVGIATNGSQLVNPNHTFTW